MTDQGELDAETPADGPFLDEPVQELLPDVAYRRLGLANIVLYGLPGAGDLNWVLIDTGLPGTSALTVEAAEFRFGVGARPAAIILTHAHPDHVGALADLSELWGVPVYAHAREHPFVNGHSAYPPPEIGVGGGIMALVSPLFSRGTVDIAPYLSDLPLDGTVPAMSGWKWIHTPGHSPGHISLWREADRTLIAGDAFITTLQESAYDTGVQKMELHGPPMYLTLDWPKAKDSLASLANLEPETAITGHGPPMHGDHLRTALHTLADDFINLAVPKCGKYVLDATNE